MLHQRLHAGVLPAAAGKLRHVRAQAVRQGDVVVEGAQALELLPQLSFVDRPGVAIALHRLDSRSSWGDFVHSG